MHAAYLITTKYCYGKKKKKKNSLLNKFYTLILHQTEVSYKRDIYSPVSTEATGIVINNVRNKLELNTL